METDRVFNKPTPTKLFQTDAHAVGSTHDPNLSQLLTFTKNLNHGSHGLQGAVYLVREHVVMLQRHLEAVRFDLSRQKRLYQTRVIEKDCEVRLAQSEASSYKLAAQARITAVETLKLAITSLLQDKIQLQEKIKQLEETQPSSVSAPILASSTTNEQQHIATMLSVTKATVDAKCNGLKASQTAVQNASAACNQLLHTVNILQQQQQHLIQQNQQPQEQHAAQLADLRSKLHAAHTDAATAAAQLVQVCDDNTRLIDSLEETELQLFEAETKAEEAEQREIELQEALGQATEEASTLKISLHKAETEVSNLRRMLRAVRPPGSATTSQTLSEGVGETHTPATQSFGQQQFKSPAMKQLALTPPRQASLPLNSSSNNRIVSNDGNSDHVNQRPSIDALLVENADLRQLVQQSEHEALQARLELQQLQKEAQGLHSQLSDVITGLTERGGNSGAPSPQISTRSWSVRSINPILSQHTPSATTGNAPTTIMTTTTAKPKSLSFDHHHHHHHQQHSALPAQQQPLNPPPLTSTSRGGRSEEDVNITTNSNSNMSLALLHKTSRGPATPLGNRGMSGGSANLNGSDSESTESAALLAELRQAMQSLDAIGADE